MTGRKIIYVIVSIFIIINLGLIYYFFYRPRNSRSTIEQVRRVRTVARKSPAPLVDRNNPPPKPPPKAPQPPDQLSKTCNREWLNLVQTPVDDLQMELLAQRPFFSSDCLKQMSEAPYFSVLKDFIENCQQKLPNQGPVFIERECVRGIVPLKALIVRSMGANNEELEGRDPSELGYELMGGILNLKEVSLSELDRNIAISDALLSREPDAYDAYKAKLLSQLVRELKYGKKVSDEDYQALYEELWAFGPADAEREETISALALAKNESEEELLNSEAPELDGLDADLVQLPFLRLKAKGEYDELGQMAEEYAASFPESYIGHMYVAEALWAKGNKAEAVLELKTVLGKDVTDEAAYEIMTRLASKPALEQLTEIEF